MSEREKEGGSDTQTRHSRSRQSPFKQAHLLVVSDVPSSPLLSLSLCLAFSSSFLFLSLRLSLLHLKSLAIPERAVRLQRNALSFAPLHCLLPVQERVDLFLASGRDRALPREGRGGVEEGGRGRDRQTDRDRQTERERERQTETERYRNRSPMLSALLFLGEDLVLANFELAGHEHARHAPCLDLKCRPERGARAEGAGGGGKRLAVCKTT